jgi:hypothetical protein
MYEGRVEFVTKSLEQLQETITRKEDNMRVVRDILMVVSAKVWERCQWRLTCALQKLSQQQGPPQGGSPAVKA